MDLPSGEFVAKGLCKQVADQRLALRAAHVEGHRRDQVPRLLVLQEDVADLGAVAVRQDDVVARRHKVREARCGRLNAASLGRRVRGLTRGLERIPADRDDKLCHPSALDGSLFLFCRVYLNVRPPEFECRTASSMGPAKLFIKKPASHRSVSPETLSAQVWNLLLRFRKTVWFRVTYLVLLGLIVPNLLPFTAGGLGCLVIIVVPLAVFLVPYYLGERSVKHFAVNALPVILIAVLVGGAQSTNLLLSQPVAVPLSSIPGPFASPTMALANGTVAPYHADPPQAFTFRVRLATTGNATPTDFRVFMNLTTISGLASYVTSEYPMTFSPGNGSPNNTRTGPFYEFTTLNLSNQIY